ncbi:hypothetical protein RCO48_38575 [Peribacillus frigoritolerans]|nr:hypothetical protein [Peribacillus frigoritolerans]
MFAILRRYQPLETHLHELEILMMDTATKRWDRWKQDYEDRVEACDVKSNKEYCTVLLEKVDTFFQPGSGPAGKHS